MNYPEYFHRISIHYIPGDMQMKEDTYASTQINTLLEIWANFKRREFPNFSYRITNAEHSVIPANPTALKAFPTIILSVNIAYTYNTNDLKPTNAKK